MKFEPQVNFATEPFKIMVDLNDIGCEVTSRFVCLCVCVCVGGGGGYIIVYELNLSDLNQKKLWLKQKYVYMLFLIRWFTKIGSYSLSLSLSVCVCVCVCV